MKLLSEPSCCKLETAVYCVGLCLTAVYLLVGVGGVVWVVLCNSDASPLVMEMRDLYMMRMETMMGSLALMGTVLVIAFIGLLTCLLLILGTKTEHRLLLLPWQLYHAAIILGCFGGGLYQAFHFTVLAERDDSLLACLALFPVVGGIFLIFIWLLVHQMAIRMRYRRQVDRVLEEKRASLASIHLSLQRQPPYEPDEVKHRSVRSMRSLRQRREGSRSRCQSEENILTAAGAGTVESPYYWVAGRARSLPRHWEREKGRGREGEDTRMSSGGCQDMEEGDRDTGHMFQVDTQGKNKKVQTKGPNNKLEKEDLSSTDGPPSSYEKGKITRNESQGKLVGKKTNSHSLYRRAEKRAGFHSLYRQADKHASCHSLYRQAERHASCHSLQRQADKHASSHSLHSTKTVSIHPEVTQYTYQQFVPR